MHAQVRDAEAVVVLEAVLHEAVETEVEQADGSGDGERAGVPSGSCDEQCQRQRRGVREVVSPGAYPWADEVREPGQVGDKEQSRDQPPGLPGDSAA